MRLCVDRPGESADDIVICTRVEIAHERSHLLDIFARNDTPIAAPINIGGWIFVVIPVGYTGQLGFISELTAPIVVTWSRDAIESIPDFTHTVYSIGRISPYLVITPGAAIWEISQDYARPPRQIAGGAPAPETLTTTRAPHAEFQICRGITYVDARGADIMGSYLLANMTPAGTKTARWLAGKSIAWAGVIAEHIDTTRVTAAAQSLERLTEQLTRAGGGGKSILEREALLERRDILITALESYDAEIKTIRMPVVRASAAELSRGLSAAPVPKPASPPPAPFTMTPADATARINEIATLLAAPAPIISPAVTIPRLIDLAAFDPAARAAAERYNETLRAEIARGEARAADAKLARAEHAKRIALEAESARLRAGLASLACAEQWRRYREWKATAGATAAEYEAAVAAERAAARLDELIATRATHLTELLEIEREIGANTSRVSSEEYRAIYSQYFAALEEHKAATREYRARGFFKTDTATPEDDRAAKAIALAGLTQVNMVILKSPPRQLRELAAAIPYVFIVGYYAADWFLPTRDSPAGAYLGRLIPLPAPTLIACACGKTYKNHRKHIESAAHKKWALQN